MVVKKHENLLNKTPRLKLSSHFLQVTKGPVKLEADDKNIDYGDFPNFDYVSDDAAAALRSK